MVSSADQVDGEFAAWVVWVFGGAAGGAGAVGLADEFGAEVAPVA